MANMKKKAKTFVENNESTIKHYAKVAGTVAGIAAIYCCGYGKGVRRGFHFGIDWFDKNFDNLELRKLWNAWVEANPDKVI